MPQPPHRGPVPKMKAWDDPTLTPYEIIQSFDNPMMKYPQAGKMIAPDEMDEIVALTASGAMVGFADDDEDDTAS